MFSANTTQVSALLPSRAIAVAHQVTPFVSAYPWSVSGFGTKYANPATLPLDNGNSVAFSPNGSAIAVAHDGSPYIAAYPWSAAGFGTKYANPATLPTGVGRGVAFSPDGAAIAVAVPSTPNIFAYPWSGSGFGTKYANPAIPLPEMAGVLHLIPTTLLLLLVMPQHHLFQFTHGQV